MGWQWLKLVLAPIAWGLLNRSLRIATFQPAQVDQAPPYIFACLHRDILPAIAFVRSARPVLLVSSSPDGDILVHTLGELEYGYVRGATGQDGGRAFVHLRRQLEQGRNLGLAVDGPKGPFGAIHEGVLQLARITEAPIVPLRAEAGSAIILDTWDRTVIPKPFSRINMIVGDPIRVERDASAARLAEVRQVLAEFFGITGGAG